MSPNGSRHGASRNCEPGTSAFNRHPEARQRAADACRARATRTPTSADDGEGVDEVTSCAARNGRTRDLEALNAPGRTPFQLWSSRSSVASAGAPEGAGPACSVAERDGGAAVGRAAGERAVGGARAVRRAGARPASAV